ncbi:hypothetical protein TWF730_009040 [Orbilia blumenaviensis]|uniref:4-(cytidine 5'-diphospho)-2-C-methyl-D-erythritol kinase n=1 Tax=Orbilia blumenaviensis TaxID=1796055 RepID=A0AAV9UZI0_9PEZI
MSDQLTKELVLRAPAKLNIYLQVGALRSDGYHDITTVYQAINLHDEVHISSSHSNQGITITISGSEASDDVPTDERNLAVKAVKLLASFVGRTNHCVEIHLVKNIPSQAGLGGGSADAAAVLVGCNELWNLALSSKELMTLGARLGEDVPFHIHGMMAIGVGHREPLTDALAAPSSGDSIPRSHIWHWVLGIPFAGGLSTKEVFGKLDELACGRNPADYTAAQIKCLATTWASEPPSGAEIAKNLYNDLEAPAVALLPVIGECLKAGLAAGALASLMTGSGSTCAFLAMDGGHAERLNVELKATGLFRRVIVTAGPVEGVSIVRQE